jgi:hypothetical protein
MGFGRRLRKRITHVRNFVTKPVAKALTPIVGKKLAVVIADPGAKVVSALHPVTTAIGKFDAVAYGTVGGGLVGAAVTKRSGNTSVFGGTGVNTIAPAAIQIEKPLLGVAGGLVAGGVGAGIAGAAGDAIAGSSDPASGRDFNSFADVGADSSPGLFAGVKSGGNGGTILILVGLGAVAVVAVLVAATKKRRK